MNKQTTDQEVIRNITLFSLACGITDLMDELRKDPEAWERVKAKVNQIHAQKTREGSENN